MVVDQLVIWRVFAAVPASCIGAMRLSAMSLMRGRSLGASVGAEPANAAHSEKLRTLWHCRSCSCFAVSFILQWNIIGHEHWVSHSGR